MCRLKCSYRTNIRPKKMNHPKDPLKTFRKRVNHLFLKDASNFYKIKYTTSKGCMHPPFKVNSPFLG